jgi:hypothetical protein
MKTYIDYLCVALITAVVFSSCGNESSHHNTSSSDTLHYTRQHAQQTYNGCVADSGNTCTYISYHYPQFDSMASPVHDSLRVLLKSLLHQEYESVPAAQKAFINDYADMMKGDSSYMSPWFEEKEVEVLLQNKRWITLGFHFSAYTGGAHGSNEQHYFLLDRETGEHLTLYDFFDSTAIYKLTALADPLFRSEKMIAPSQTYEEAGYWFKDEHFYLNNNFYIHPGGITFYYNPYEVSSYANGSTVITIPANKIGKLLRQEWRQ